MKRKTEGYVFSPYIRMSYMLALEDYYLAEIPNYRLWYGIYYDEAKRTESIRRIKPKLVEDEITTEGHKQPYLKTDQTDKSLFIIGTFDSVPKKKWVSLPVLTG
jgi:hypothetical protein